MNSATNRGHGLDDLQGNIDRPYEDAHIARMRFLRFKGAGARHWIAKIQRVIGGDEPLGSQPRAILALTYEGLGALQVSDFDLAAFPEAFRQGMARRGQLLGDPPFNKPTDSGVHLPKSMTPCAHNPEQSVHALLIVYAKASSDLERHLQTIGNSARTDSGASYPTDWDRFAGLLATELTTACNTIALSAEVEELGTQDLHLPFVAGREVVEYFGFRDGVSQPQVLPADVDQNELARIVVSSANPLLHNSTFLVVRQLEQDVAMFWEQLAEQAVLLKKSAIHVSAQKLAEQIVGRQINGDPLAPQTSSPPDPDYAFDPKDDGASCPFHSHVRRVNPRLDKRNTPRILRRAMSYADSNGTRGLMFMAFNASIEAQFEFLQRNWIQRGTNVGLFSTDRDLLAGLAQKGVSSEFSSQIGGRPFSLDLPKFVELKWGGYFWVPSCAALKKLATTAQSDVAQRAPAQTSSDLMVRLDKTPKDQQNALIRAWLDDPNTASLFWEQVSARKALKVGPWAFVADPQLVQQILEDTGTLFSVDGYGERMLASTGPFFLGMDAASPAYEREHPAVAVIPTSPAEVLNVQQSAMRATERYLSSVVDGQARIQGGKAQFPLTALMAVVLDDVCTQQFGVAGPGAGSLLAWSGAITNYFFRMPADDIDRANCEQAGRQLRAYLTSLVEASRAASDKRRRQRLHKPEQGDRLGGVLDKMERAIGGGEHVSTDVLGRNLFGIMTGSLSATLVLFVRGLNCYLDSTSRDALVWPTNVAGLANEARPAQASLFGEMVAKPLAKKKRAAPESLYRKYNGDAAYEIGSATIKKGDLVVLWFGGLLPSNPDALFGLGPHACPGKDMGKAIVNGTLQGLYAAWKDRAIAAVGSDFELQLSSDPPPLPQSA
jgi:Dyp-type peroxidase family